jgi:hypothetical protein
MSHTPVANIEVLLRDIKYCSCHTDGLLLHPPITDQSQVLADLRAEMENPKRPRDNDADNEVPSTKQAKGDKGLCLYRV